MDDGSRTEIGAPTIDEATIGRTQADFERIEGIKRAIVEETDLLATETDPEEQTILRNSIATLTSALERLSTEVDERARKIAGASMPLLEAEFPTEQASE